MYGCALMLREVKKNQLEGVSLGRLYSLIKKALSDQVLIHYKTLIIKDESQNIISEKEKKRLIFEAKSRIV